MYHLCYMSDVVYITYNTTLNVTELTLGVILSWPNDIVFLPKRWPLSKGLVRVLPPCCPVCCFGERWYVTSLRKVFFRYMGVCKKHWVMRRKNYYALALNTFFLSHYKYSVVSHFQSAFKMSLIRHILYKYQYGTMQRSTNANISVVCRNVYCKHLFWWHRWSVMLTPARPLFLSFSSLYNYEDHFPIWGYLFSMPKGNLSTAYIKLSNTCLWRCIRKACKLCIAAINNAVLQAILSTQQFLLSFTLLLCFWGIYTLYHGVQWSEWSSWTQDGYWMAP